jgi:hypothetical protein
LLARTAIHWAARAGNLQIVSILSVLKQGHERCLDSWFILLPGIGKCAASSHS